MASLMNISTCLNYWTMKQCPSLVAACKAIWPSQLNPLALTKILKIKFSYQFTTDISFCVHKCIMKYDIRSLFALLFFVVTKQLSLIIILGTYLKLLWPLMWSINFYIILLQHLLLALMWAYALCYVYYDVCMVGILCDLYLIRVLLWVFLCISLVSECTSMKQKHLYILIEHYSTQTLWMVLEPWWGVVMAYKIGPIWAKFGTTKYYLTV